MVKSFSILFLSFASICCYSNNSITPLGPDFKVDGLGAPELSAEWWKWAMSSPDDVSPVRDLTGQHCGVGQKGNVWFLAGSYGNAKVRRSCVLPAGKTIFFPIINMIYYHRSNAKPTTCDEVKRGAAINNDSAIDLYVELNGINIIDARRYRASTEKCFNVFERRLNAYDAYPSASDGYWIALSPLKKGKYNIKFGGRYNNKTSAYGKSLQDIEYELLIE